jgi:uncharacterized damage-inducible protein DinB
MNWRKNLMLTPEQMAHAFGRNAQIVKMQTKDLSHEDSLIQLPFRANCLNWVVGHLLTNRNAVMRLLEAEPALDPERLAPYRRESEPLTAESPGVIPLEDLAAALEESQERLADILDAITSAELNREVAFFGDSSQAVSEWLFFFYFHDCYHTGQTEILRQASGVNDKVI